MKLFLKLGYLILIIRNIQCIRICKDIELHKPTVSALLHLHYGEKCGQINFFAIQQKAILESTLAQVNQELNATGIQLDLQIYDTCSNKGGAQIAALKALVDSKHTCMKSPLFLGYLGPENIEELETVQYISSIFEIPHIIPHSYDKNFKKNIFHISKYPIAHHTKVIQLLLKQLKLQRIIILTEDDHLSKWKVEDLLNTLEYSHCLSQPLIIQKDRILNLINDFNQDFTAILAIIETPDKIEWILDDLKYINRTILISVGKFGVLSWPETINNVYIIQMLSSSPIGDLNEGYNTGLLNEFYKQMATKCQNENIMCDSTLENEQDWTINLLQYSILLYSANVKAAYYLKCQNGNTTIGLCPKLNYISGSEWNYLLSKASFYIKPPSSVNQNNIVTFNMETNVTYKIMMLDDSMIQVGEYKNRNLRMADISLDEIINEENETTIKNCKPFKKITLAVQTNTVHKENPDISKFDIFDLRDLSFFQLIGIICGIGFGLLILFIIIFCNIYRTFVIVSKHSSAVSSSS